jgi:type IV secretory pathway VirB6-like protein
VTAVRLLAHGIVLPTEVLFTGWFQALALFVALNTLVFAGLALVKLVPKRRFRAADAVRARRSDGPDGR